MKFLCDVHIAIKVSKHLSEIGFESEHVNRILDKWNTKDSDIIDFADKNDFIVISKDADFKTSYLMDKGPKKLIRFKLGNISNKFLLIFFDENIERINEINTKYDNFLIEVSQSNISIITK